DLVPLPPDHSGAGPTVWTWKLLGPSLERIPERTDVVLQPEHAERRGEEEPGSGERFGGERLQCLGGSGRWVQGGADLRPGALQQRQAGQVLSDRPSGPEPGTEVPSHLADVRRPAGMLAQVVAHRVRKGVVSEEA